MLVMIKGAGDIASGIALRLWRAGINVVMTDLPKPSSIRRTVCFSEAVYRGETKVEEVRARLAANAADALRLLEEVILPVIVDPKAESAKELHPDVIVVDPPRKGCDTKCLETIVQMSPKRVVYVSCDSATLARDLKFLCENGYEVKRVRGCDMFGQTVSVETVVKLSLKKDTPKIEVTMGPDEESNYTPEEKATYSKIKEYVKEKYGVNVHTSYIAQVKRMCGLDMGENYNKSKKENPEVKQCPQEKVEYIKDALRHFGVI